MVQNAIAVICVKYNLFSFLRRTNEMNKGKEKENVVSLLFE